MSWEGLRRTSSPYRHRSSPRDSSPYRRHSPPQDTRHVAPSGPSDGLQIRGLASNQEDRHKREDPRDQRSRRDYPEDRERREHPGTYRDHDDHRYDRPNSRSPRRWDRHGYRDRDREDYRSPEPSSAAYHSRSSSPRRDERAPDYGGPPSREVMLEGLPLEMTEDDIKLELQTGYKIKHLEDVRIIRQRGTGVSRGFGFICFPTLEESTDFVHRNYPTIHLYGSATSDKNNQATAIRIIFSRERAAPDRSGAESEWTCKNCSAFNYSRRVECFRCQSSRSSAAAGADLNLGNASNFANTGDSDVSPDSTPSQYLLFRSLEPSVSEELLAKGAAKLLKVNDVATNMDGSAGKSSIAKVASTSTVAHAGAQQGSIRRVLLVRDRRSDESWRYGFVEFATVEDAQAALAKWNSLEKYTISSKPVLVSYIHAGVFVPVLTQPTPGREYFTFAPAANPSLKLAYWDQAAYVKELVISAGDAEMVVDATQSGSTAVSEKGDTGRHGKNPEKKSKKRKADPAAGGSTKKSMPSHLEFWTNRFNELHGNDALPPTTSDSTTDPINARTQSAATKATKSDNHDPPSQSFADPIKNCCYLCSRQFKSAAEVNKHERLSDLHQTNLQNTDLVAKALVKLEKAGVAIATPSSVTTSKADVVSEGQDYRDRARERRALFNQPKQPGFKGQGTGRKSSPAPNAGTTPDATLPTNDDNTNSLPTASSSSKGASLLGKMGWKSGSGLGASGTGATAPVATDLYVAGVGLGAAGGKIGDAVEEANRSTIGDYSAFAKRTREKARERFDQIG